MLDLTPTDWTDRAACIGFADMFVGDPKPAPTVLEAAARICAGCPVKGECGALADAQPATWGMWAGVWHDQTYRVKRAVA